MRKRTSRKISPEHRASLESIVAPAKALIPEDKFMALFAYTTDNNLYHCLIAPLPLVELRETCSITGKNKVQGREMISASAEKLEEKVKQYLAKYETT